MSAPFDAFWLPGFDAAHPGVRWETLDAGGVALRYPVLSGADMDALASRLRSARAAALYGRPVDDVVRAIDAAAARLVAVGPQRDANVARLAAVTRLSPEMVELILERMAADWRRPALERLLRAELGDPAVLDGFVREASSGRSVRAAGPALVLNVFAGNVPGVAVSALVRCLLVKSAVIGKTAADDPVLPVLFARALAEVEPSLASCVAVTYWPGGAGEAEETAIQHAQTIVVYGGADAVRSVRARARAGTRVIEHGPRMSFGFVAREAATRDGAQALARDVALAAATFDQHGCVSLHGVFVERGGAVEPRELARLIFDELRALERTLPAGRLLADEAAGLHAERGRSEFAADAGGGELHASEGSAATVVFTETPDATPSCLDRFVRVSAVDDLEASLPAFAASNDLLQTAGLAATDARRATLAEALARAGFTRIADFAAMPWPPAHWHHDGSAPLRELIRWVDLEAGDG